MNRFTQLMISSLILLTISLPTYASDPEPATVMFDAQGFTVDAPSGASMLEVRLMGPERTLLFEAQTGGESIDWQLSGTEADGEYRYEAVVVMEIDGKAHQTNLPGGFEVEAGSIVPPPLPVNADDLIAIDHAD